MKISNLIIVLVGMIFISNNSFAANKDCKDKTLTKVYVQANRVSGTEHANKLVIGFEECTGVSLGYIENTDPAYSGMLSMALTAFTLGKQVRIMLDDSQLASGAMRIQYLLLEN